MYLMKELELSIVLRQVLPICVTITYVTIALSLAEAVEIPWPVK